MDTMTGFRNNIVRARGYEFSDEQMRCYRIKGVFNSMVDADYCNEAYMESFIMGCYNPGIGEAAISESAIRSAGKGFVRILSVIVFADVESMELYILANKRLYLAVDRTMNGRMN